MSTNENKPNKPRDFSMKIRSTTETAFQRSIWGRITSEVGETTVTWIDIEIPVDCSGNPRGQCVDLIGKDNNGRLVLCELKFGDPGNGSPAEAAEQIRLYKDYAAKNASSLGHHKKAETRGTLDWSIVKSTSTRLVVAANSAYWEYWRQRGELEKSSLVGIECYKLPIDTDYFENKKPEGETYTPEITEEQNIWTPVDL